MKSKFIPYIILALSLSSCQVMKNQVSENGNFKENFNSQRKFEKYWEDDASQSPQSYYLEFGHLRISTRPDTADRVKVKTKRNDFGIGSYQWRIYVPYYELHDQCNIGAFLYHSGEIHYEIDFEIGSGTIAHRDELNAKLNEALVHCTSQLEPHDTEIFKVKSKRWHDFKILLIDGENNQYLIEWYIDNILVKSLQTNINTDIKFSVHNSLENLQFIGEQLPIKENYVLFDQFIFRE